MSWRDFWNLSGVAEIPAYLQSEAYAGSRRTKRRLVVVDCYRVGLRRDKVLGLLSKALQGDEAERGAVNTGMQVHRGQLHLVHVKLASRESEAILFLSLFEICTAAVAVRLSCARYGTM